MIKKQMLAVDFGASGGRVVQGSWDGKTITARELHRFTNEPVTANGTVYWDVLRLLHEMKQGMQAAKEAGGFSSISVDTWGVDFALLDSGGALLSNPVHYRDGRTAGMLQKALQKVSAEALYKITGNQQMEINTLFQLLALQERQPWLLGQAKDALMLPDLFTYFLSGEKCAERTIASTTTLLDMHTGAWSAELLKAFDLPGLFPDITDCACVAGALLPEIRRELGIQQALVISGAGHDTQNALVAVPAKEKDFVFISSGTWSLVGTESDTPFLSEEARAFGLSNECAAGGKYAVLKNITGLWLLQESRRQWAREGIQYSYAQLEQLARAEAPMRSFINVEDAAFVSPGDMPARIRQFCRETAQPVPETVGQVVRCIYESLAMKYRETLHQLQRSAKKEYGCIHIVGGGTKDDFLSQLTADVCAIPVTAGPVEATVFGNFSLQLMALGEIDNLYEARDILNASETPKEFLPRQDLQAGYQKYKEMFSC